MNTSTPIQTQDPNSRGEQIIFDIVIQQKLKHVIVIKDYASYYINLDGEDLGSFTREEDGAIKRFEQPKGALKEVDEYFDAIIGKLDELNKL